MTKFQHVSLPISFIGFEWYFIELGSTVFGRKLP